MTSTTERPWINLLEAAARLQTTPYAVKQLIRQRRITVRDMPGTYAKISRSDVERLAQASVRPALAAGA